MHESKHPLVKELKQLRRRIADYNLIHADDLAQFEALIRRVDMLCDLLAKEMGRKSTELLADIQRPSLLDRVVRFFLGAA